jgi:predicted O-linked N-acetylglucosamine transferase (SPINDLY family)
MSRRVDRTVELMTQANEFVRRGSYTEAIACYDKVLAKKPRQLDVINNRANCLALLGRHQEALKNFDVILASRPDDVRARLGRGNALQNLARGSDAIADFDLVLARDADNIDALYFRGKLHQEMARPDLAMRDLRRAAAIDPTDTNVATALIFARHFDADASNEDLQADRIAWGRRFDHLLAGVAHTNQPDPDRRLRIGYVSSQFRHHASSVAFGAVIVHHDPAAFEVTCYSDTQVADATTAVLRQHAERWHDVAGLSDVELCQRIRADRIDILVDLVGHMAGHRLSAFARKPAPIQVTAWGEPGSTGLKAMDYYFADAVILPPEERPLLSEKIVELPCWVGYWLAETLPEVAPLPALTRGYVTFGSYNRLAKVLPSVLRTWAAILRRVPNSRLVLKDRLTDQQAQPREIIAALAHEGIAPERITILDYSPIRAHLAAYGEIDLGLDPFPHGGAMTTLDALAMGVPVITAKGRTIPSRNAATVLTALGLTDFVAADYDEYVELAVTKASRLDELAKLRAGLRERLQSSAIWGERYARAAEAQFRDIWRRWCAETVR